MGQIVRGAMLDMNIIQFMKSIYIHRQLLIDMAKRDLRNQYASSYLGFFWTILVPLLSSIVYIVVFSMLMRGKMGEAYSSVNFITYYFTGFTPWLLFNETFTRNLSIIRNNANLITKTSFPSQILPFITLLSSIFTHVIMLIICIIIIKSYGLQISDRFFLLPIYFIFLVIITMGLSLMFSAVAVYVTDLTQIIPILLSLLFYMTPILYSPEIVQALAPYGAIKIVILTINPFHYIVEGYRMCLFNVPLPINYFGLLILTFYSILFVIAGAYIFKKLKSSFADVL